MVGGSASSNTSKLDSSFSQWTKVDQIIKDSRVIMSSLGTQKGKIPTNSSNSDQSLYKGWELEPQYLQNLKSKNRPVSVKIDQLRTLFQDQHNQGAADG